MARFDLVIFDCDGVLVDSEELANRVFAELLNELGANVTLETMFERFVGHSMADCLVTVEELLGRAPPSDLVETLRRRTSAILTERLEPVPGITAVLDSLSIPYCVASSGDHDKMRTTLGITGLLSRFEGRLFSATEVPRGKPAPDVFLYAARQMGVAPARAAVVEDSPVGVQAGLAAGMTVFGYAARTPTERLRKAGATVFGDMSELVRLLAG
ncbi:MAG TPA: HAD family hydrolase [Polyangiaceae bacterium]|jgi:HAD superfamily hydrolase (TIGR01509 family)|nr:HAD family hydrolase [Polyangiaceae bacterium]